MAPELENHWFERIGGRCNARTVSWQGGLLITLYVLAVTAATSLLLDRTIPGFLAAVALATAIFLWIVAIKTRRSPGD